MQNTPLALLVLVTAACGPTVTPTEDGSVPPGVDGGSADAHIPPLPDGAPPPIDGGGPSPGAWATHSHPCVGNRTTALHVDTDGTIWVGCGDTTSGMGVYLSDDGGATWTAPATSPAGRAAGMRVNSIERGPDGQLYLGGTIGAMVARLDTTRAPMLYEEVLTSVPQVGRQYVVGKFRQRSDGSAMAESLNGTDVLFREAASTGTSASMWIDASAVMSPARQMLDLTVVEDRFYGCGSTIAQPPLLFLPARGASAEPYAFEILQLTDQWGGELWGIAAEPGRVVTVGVDQTNAIGKIFVSGSDLYDAADYTEIDVTPLVAGTSGRTWARGVCMRGDRIAVVGENQPLRNGGGFVLLSDDGGLTFEDVTPSQRPQTVTQCVVRPSGSVIAAGDGGWIGIRS